MIEKRPIRRDRVVIALIFLLAVILIPILLHSGGKSPTPTVVVGQPGTTTPAQPSTPTTPTTPSPSTPATSTTTTPTPAPAPKKSTSPFITHTVAAGETLSQIAARMGVSVDQLVADNRIYSPQDIKPGEVLHAVKDGILHLIKPGQTLTDISITYSVPVEKIVKANKITDPAKIYAGEEIIIPGANASLWKEVITLSKGKESRFIWPLLGKITSPFGWRIHPVLKTRQFHNGIDIDAPVGTTVHAAAPGKVYFVGEQPGYGNVIILAHADNYYTIYGHLSKALVYTGQFVEAGQAIAMSGNTGISSGPHLHFEIRHGAEFPIDPMRYLP